LVDAGVGGIDAAEEGEVQGFVRQALAFPVGEEE
jgi:hypothetical protein